MDGARHNREQEPVETMLEIQPQGPALLLLLVVLVNMGKVEEEVPVVMKVQEGFSLSMREEGREVALETEELAAVAVVVLVVVVIKKLVVAVMKEEEEQVVTQEDSNNIAHNSSDLLEMQNTRC